MRIEKTAQSLPKSDEQKQEKEKIHQPIGKVVALVALAVAASVLFWWAVRLLLHFDLDLKRISSIVYPVLLMAGSLGVFLGIAGLAFYLLAGFLPRLLIAFLGAVASFIFFPISLFNLIAAALVAFSLYQWSSAVHGDVRSRQKITVVRSVSTAMPFTVTFLLIAIALTYYASLTNGDQRSQTFRNNLVDGATEIVNQILVKEFPGYRAEITLDEFIVNFGVKGFEQSLGSLLSEEKQQAEKQVKSVEPPPGLPPEFERLFKDYVNRPPGELIPQAAIDEAVKKAEGQVVAQIRQQFLDALGIQALGTDQMNLVIHRVVDQKVGQVLGPYLKFIPVLLALSVYFLLQIFSIVYILVARLVSVFVYWIFRLVRFVHVETVQIPAERARL